MKNVLLNDYKKLNKIKIILSLKEIKYMPKRHITRAIEIPCQSDKIISRIKHGREI